MIRNFTFKSLLKKRFFFGLAIFFGVLMVLFWIDQVYVPRKIHFQKTKVYIYNNTPTKKIANILREKGVIKSRTMFLLYLKLTGKQRDLHAGLYILSPSYSLARVVRVLEEKEGPSNLTRVTIPEGYSLMDMAELLDQKEVVLKGEFLNYARYKAKADFKDKYKFLEEIPTTNLEGYLFPDTYLFAKGTTLKVIVDAMLSQYNKKIYFIWENVPSHNNNLNLQKTMALASIIEKEARERGEMPLISSVFYNRIVKKMNLESCPTVLYAIGDRSKRQVLYRDLEVKSPYNTYRNFGLPPTPIASPGVSAFLAALYPFRTEYLFFVANGDGTHHFSKNLKEHIAVQNKQSVGGKQALLKPKIKMRR